MLPSRYFPSGRLAIEHQSTVRIGYADVQRGTLDGLPVIVTQPVPYNPAGSVSEGGSQEVALNIQFNLILPLSPGRL